jgi:membrane-associated phospholipid phosphatase
MGLARSGIFGLIVAVFLCTRRAIAQQASEASVPLAPPLLHEPTSLWRESWPQFSLGEAVATGIAAVGTGVIFLIGPDENPHWRGGILFDNAVRNEFKAHSPATRQTFRTIGNYTYRLSPIVPVFDVFAVALLAHSDSKLALNLGLIAAEAYSYSGFSSFITTELVRRNRPDSECGNSSCSNDTQSFFSGHAAISATAAGLVCADHTRIALYGNAIADAAICAFMSVNALATLTTRVVADRHYATDVLVGSGVGFGFGYAVPVLLHYARSNGSQIAVGPDPLCGSNCVGVSGAF